MATASGPAGEVTIFASPRKRGRPGRRQDSNRTPVKCCLQTCSPPMTNLNCRFCVCVRKHIISGLASIVAICVSRVTSQKRRGWLWTPAGATGRNGTSEIAVGGGGRSQRGCLLGCTRCPWQTQDTRTHKRRRLMPENKALARDTHAATATHYPSYSRRASLIGTRPGQDAHVHADARPLGQTDAYSIYGGERSSRKRDHSSVRPARGLLVGCKYCIACRA